MSDSANDKGLTALLISVVKNFATDGKPPEVVKYGFWNGENILYGYGYAILPREAKTIPAEKDRWYKVDKLFIVCDPNGNEEYFLCEADAPGTSMLRNVRVHR